MSSPMNSRHAFSDDGNGHVSTLPSCSSKLTRGTPSSTARAGPSADSAWPVICSSSPLRVGWAVRQGQAHVLRVLGVVPPPIRDDVKELPHAAGALGLHLA